MPLPLRRLLSVVLGCLLAVVWLVLPMQARADGGASIAAAPAVVFGQQQFGNTATGAAVERGCYPYTLYSSYWLLPVTAGDRLTIDWQSQAIETDLLVFPTGTTDFNADNVSLLERQELNPGGKNQLVVQAPVSGTLPMAFQGCSANLDPDEVGPYAFTAYVRHVVKLSLPAISTVRRRGTIKVAAHNAEGGVLSDPFLLVDVQLRLGRQWQTVGSASVANSVAAVPLRIPRRYVGQMLKLRALAHGGDYLSAATRSRRVLITMKPKRVRR